MDPSVVLSVFEDRYARDVRQEEGRWSELVDTIAGAPEVPTKEQCRMLKLARFGDQRTDKGSLRHDANVLEVYGIEADYDAGEVTFESAMEKLGDYDILALGYESWSSTGERPRWRILAPFSYPRPPEDRKRYVEVLNGMLGGILAPESDVLSQVYYFGKPVGEERKSVSIEGASRCIDELPTAELDAFRLPLRAPACPPPLHRSTNAKSKAAASNKALLDELLAGKDVHGNALRLVGRWISIGLSNQEISAIMTPLAQQVAAVRGPERAAILMNGELQRMLTGARSKGRASHRRRFTDLGNAERLRDRHGENLRFCPQAKKWLYWDGERWLWDEDGEIDRRAAETVRLDSQGFKFDYTF